MYTMVNFAKPGVQLTMMATPFSTTIHRMIVVIFHELSFVSNCFALYTSDRIEATTPLAILLEKIQDQQEKAKLTPGQ